MTDELIEVTQADIAAVKRFHEESIRHVHAALLDPVKAHTLGEEGDYLHPIYQAFARHRIAATDTQVSKHSELAEESLALELLGRLTDKIEAGVDAIFLPREKAIACVSEFIAEQREGFLIDLATVMHKHLENWPEGEFKKVSTAMALLDKTLHSALNPSKHDYWGAGEPDCPKEIKAGNGELHTLRCRVCGMDNPSDNRCAALRQAPDAQVDKLVSAARSMLPRNVCITNRNIPDSMIVLLETTMGELRAVAAALDGMGEKA